MNRYVSFRLDGQPFSSAVLLSSGCQAVPLKGDKAETPCCEQSAVHMATVGVIPGTGLFVKSLHSLCVDHAYRLDLNRPPFMQHLIGPYCGQAGTVFWADEEGRNGCQPETEADPEAVHRITAMALASWHAQAQQIADDVQVER